jgi:hypothetical protein
MKPLTFADVERELNDLADQVDDDLDDLCASSDAPDKLRALARRIAVQIEMQALDQPTA